MWQASPAHRRLDGCKFRRQHPIGPFVADFACVESPLRSSSTADSTSEPDAITADARRSTFFHLQGFTTLRFTNREVLAETESVLTAIHQWLDKHHPHPSPLPPAGEGVNESTIMSKQMQDAYIVAATRTPIGKARPRLFRNTRPDELLVAAIKSALRRCPALDPRRSRTRSSAARCRKPSRA